MARCVSPHYQAARECLEAGGDPDIVDGCLDTFRDTALRCTETESYGALLAELSECGRCEVEAIPARLEEPKYCVDDLLEE